MAGICGQRLPRPNLRVTFFAFPRLLQIEGAGASLPSAPGVSAPVNAFGIDRAVEHRDYASPRSHSNPPGSSPAANSR